ncbi:hypothetical protein H4Q26_002422 [Puccinia striiformis f. sp. tritici PST-130]|uniref:Uncharacterized protein n=2 Tax=Puccinia striiformis TaxID=27350 RepID=A0A0L0VA44_9BASI|nr:hypothetical protein H4Q26_002422 [Puccinia striiformis f. sp. tritici PST-130]KNE96065.1 hypothetical protein PSTG_10641 [Puccinia striiformis f. sp. tritici PST-78]KNE96066.1 hypothetical protein, variant [Puccinia striiformis f. sp. tritici PST-78]POW16806.1 hypothetical protein PSTT_01032 [Puccinia striiformis]
MPPVRSIYSREVMQESERFAKPHLHTKDEHVEFFNQMLEAAGVERLQEYHDDLDNVLELNETNQETVLSRWREFYLGEEGSFSKLKEVLNLTEEDEIKQLVELAHFKRFPTEEYSSGMSQKEMLTRIQTIYSQEVVQERERFGELHSCEGAILVESFSVILEAAGFKKLRQYLQKLENILNLKSSDTKQEDLIASWRKFYQGGKDGFAQLKKMLNLTHGDDKIKELIELAHFNRFPTKEDSSGMSEEEMLNALATIESRNQPTELERFEKLHVYDADSLVEQFTVIVEAAGVKRLREYHNDLEGILKLESFGDKAFSVLLRWQKFYQGEEALAGLDMILQGTVELNAGDIKKLIQLAHFERFPTKEGLSGMSETTMLRALETVPRAQTNTDPFQRIEWFEDISRECFDEPYMGYDLIVPRTLRILRDFATQWRTTEHKVPCTSIVGPTLSGKSRLIVELTEHVCVVYVCIRPRGSTDQPPRSQIADLMLPATALKLDMDNHYTCLLTAIFRVVTSFFSRPHRQTKPLAEQLEAWNRYSLPFNNDDVRFSLAVRKMMKKLAPQSTWSRNDRLCEAARAMNRSIQGRDDEEEVAEEGQLKVLLAIDEAHHLIDHKGAGNIPYLHPLCRVLSKIPSSQGFFSVFTNTIFQVEDCDPVSDDGRVGSGFGRGEWGFGQGHKLFAPIYPIPTLNLSIPPPPTSWHELVEPGRLFNYGCPFYGSFFQLATEMGKPSPFEDTLWMAQTKLLDQQRFPSADDLTSQQIFALLGSMIETRLATGSSLNFDLVWKHAAHCMFVDPDQEYIISSYPPQFAYASAANRLLAYHDAHWIKCINVLAHAVQTGLVPGDAGEIATRCILIYAMQQTNSLSSGNSSHSVRLEDFLKTLTGKNPEKIQFGTTDPEGKERLLAEGRIFFNHFARIGYAPSAEDLMRYLYQGLAVQFQPGEEGLSDLFTLYLAPESESHELDLKNITFCGVQTRNHDRPIQWQESSDWSKSSADIKRVDNPYLILLFGLRAKPSEGVGKKWLKPYDEEDTRRVHYQFLGLDQIACLSRGMITALTKLINADPEDLLKLHQSSKPNVPLDEHTIQWAKNVHRHCDRMDESDPDDESDDDAPE